MFFDPKKTKKHTKILLILLVVVISASLILSSIQWAGGPAPALNEPKPNMTEQDIAKFFQDQIKSMEDAVEADPENADLLAELAALYLLTGDNENAVPRYQQLIEMEPDNVDARLSLASLYFYERKYDLAEEHVKHVLTNSDENIDAHHMYAYILAYGHEDYQGAITEMEKFIELAGEGPYVEQAEVMIEEWKKNLE